MLRHFVNVIILGVFAVILLINTPVGAIETFKVSTYGAGHQIWFEVEDFDERDPADETCFALADDPGAFGRSINSVNNQHGEGMIRYTFDISKAGGTGGSWYFWGRVINPNNNSDFMLVAGHPGDPVPFTQPVTGLTNDQRVFEESLGTTPDGWAWSGDSHNESHTKTLQSGENTMYIISRESGAIWDVFMWTDDPDYVPTDADYENAAVPSAGQASNPNPFSGAEDVPRDIPLSWTPGDYAVTHDVYFGMTFEDVNEASRADARGVLVGQGQSEAVYIPSAVLDFSTTYYWRIDEVNGTPDNAIYEGAIWSFTTEPYAYTVEEVVATTNAASLGSQGPENIVNGSGLNADGEHSIVQTDMWTAAASNGGDLPYIQFEFNRVHKLNEMTVWNHNLGFEFLLGVGIKDATIQYSVDGVQWMDLGDIVLAQAPGSESYTGQAVALDGIAAQFVRLVINSTYGTSGQFGLAEVRFSFIPAFAREPKPQDGAVDVDIDATLSWRSGRGAVTHEVYLGTNPNALDMVGISAEARYIPEALDFGATHYWQVVEVNEAEATPAWSSDIWSFSTVEYALVDGFEDYNDDIDAGTTIWQSWIDGLDDTANGGSIVGYGQSPFAEQTIVNSGSQSMPLSYDNTESPFFSEAERTWATAQNWTNGSPEILRLYVRGSSFDLYEISADSFIVGAAGVDIWGTADEFRYVYKQLTGDGSIVARIDGIDEANVWSKACVMIRETLDPGSVNAMAYVTRDGRAGWQHRPTTDGDSVSTRSDTGTITVPHWLRLTRQGNLFTAEHSVDGMTWEPMIEQENPAEESFGDVVMAQTVFVGVGYTSHEADVLGQAEFSNVATEGNVTGQWQLADVGIDHPVGTNDPDVLYVAIEDASGKRQTVNVGVAPLGYGTWRLVEIPLDAFSTAGVNLATVKKMAIGIGDPSVPMKGAGMIFVDDISFGTSVD